PCSCGWPSISELLTGCAGSALINKEKLAHSGGAFCRSISEHGQLIGILSGSLAALARKSDDIFILPVREGQDVNIAFLGQVALDPGEMRLETVLAVAEAGIDRKLAHLEPFVEQKLAEFGGVACFFLRANRQIEHDENPHQTIPAQ